MIKRILFISLVLIVIGLFLRRADIYGRIIKDSTGFFRDAWRALTNAERV